MTTTILESNTLSKEEVLEQLQTMTEKQLQFLRFSSDTERVSGDRKCFWDNSSLS